MKPFAAFSLGAIAGSLCTCANFVTAGAASTGMAMAGVSIALVVGLTLCCEAER